MMKPFSDDGVELDAKFSVSVTSDDFDVVVESRGGVIRDTGRTRNRDYAPAMSLLLCRMKIAGMLLNDIQVASTTAMSLPTEQQRRVSLDDYNVPLKLKDVADVDDLRRSIARACAGFGRPQGNRRANNTRRMRLRMNWARAINLNGSDIEKLLAHPGAIDGTAELPTASQVELEERTMTELNRFRTAQSKGIPVSVPVGRRPAVPSIASVSRFSRDPVVVAYVLFKAAGRCEVCTSQAPFFRQDGTPYLEIHHVRRLADGGPDTVDNAIACCPNCHRRLHHGIDGERERLDLVNRIDRLVNYPEVRIDQSSIRN